MMARVGLGGVGGGTEGGGCSWWCLLSQITLILSVYEILRGHDDDMI